MRFTNLHGGRLANPLDSLQSRRMLLRRRGDKVTINMSSFLTVVIWQNGRVIAKDLAINVTTFWII
ncbi:hypothetical protein [Alteromonas sp. ASW11-130]|uniref:hypothetical protein n=1 Tax=Alteromonas sp. ASW11-130 TaxID=3015775 RepID=UPI0022427D94|nr:hypothetical protein [Alteromonas sp. ASW11-130]MCW8090761.1 hypothetical protein [Alteromonas sp. ASW11-130]